VEEFEASAGSEPPATLRSAARLAAPVLRHLGDHADVRLTASEMARVAGASPQEGEQLTAWLLRAGLV
jgi:hypothetical protein